MNVPELEWVGGLVAMPSYVTGEGEPYRPEMLLWMIPDGPVVGMTMAKPGELLSNAVDHLRDTMRAPMAVAPHTPARIRVASRELAATLREAVATIEIVCAPTPEIDQMLKSMKDHFRETAEAPLSFLDGGHQPDSVAAFFRAAAAMFRASPWRVVPGDMPLLVTVDALGVVDAALSVIGQMNQSFGFVLFASEADFDAYANAAMAFEHGARPSVPPHLGFNFERGADIAPALRTEIAKYRWQVAGASAYPCLVAIDEDIVSRPPTPKELVLAEALALALAQITTWDPRFDRTFTVATHDGSIDVVLRTPERRPISLEDELVAEFVVSPECKAVEDVGASRSILEFAASYLNTTIASIGASQLRELVFEIIPRHVMMDARESHDFVVELRAFFAFLKRAHAFKRADACLRVLGDGAIEKLESALSDSRNFGMAKSLMMGGHDAGFDISTKEGVMAWAREIEGKPIALPEWVNAVGRNVGKKKKKKRKVARKARKKNR